MNDAKSPIVGILCIGEELLDGRISDINTKNIAKLLSGVGLLPTQSATVGDSMEVGVAQLNHMSDQHDILIVTGGLGPTRDDITRDMVAQWMGVTLVFDEEAYERMKARVDARGYEMPPNNRRQCFFPEGATILHNGVGSASGFAVNHRDTLCFFLPGVPKECCWFVEHAICPSLAETYGEQSLIQHQHHVLGMPESQVEDRLKGIDQLVEMHGVTLAYCAEFPIIEITLSAPTAAQIEPINQWIEDHLNGYLVGDHERDLRRLVADALIANNATVATAESCTAGGIGAALTDLSGSSAWFEQGFITYANSAKMSMVGVTKEALEAYGAVSAQVVCQMANGAVRKSRQINPGHDRPIFALAVSGIAGPTGATPGKPVGTVQFALQTPEGCYQMCKHFKGLGRDRVRQITIHMALAFLLWYLDGSLDVHEDVAGPFDDDAVWSTDLG